MAYDKIKQIGVYLSLGSNLGDRKKNILNATELLEQSIEKEIIISSFYESKALGFDSKKKFLNICAKFKTSIPAHDLLVIINKIEEKLGRIRVENSGYIDRIIDIDILFYHDSIINTKKLKIPHPQLSNRIFVLIPLQEIAKNLIHTGNEEDINTLIQNCNDDSNLILYED
jgi:deoxyguanosine kinase